MKPSPTIPVAEASRNDGEHSVTVRPHPSRPSLTDRDGLHKHRAWRTLVFLWLSIVAVPWLLQIRSFLALAVRHKLNQNLIPSQGARKVYTPAEVLAHCPVRSLILSGVYFDLYPTHFYESEGVVSGSVLCHFVLPQYNCHGMYNVQPQKVPPADSSPRSCANDSYAFDYYYYHGSIGYFALYDEGTGSYCSLDHTTYVVTSGVGSKDINFSALAQYEGAPGYHSSWNFSLIGTIWLAYRALVVSRSYKSCSRYGHRLDLLREPLSFSNGVVYVQQAARLAAHDASNWHRLGLLYLLLEGLMTDLLMLIAYDGYAAKLQYISLGYNIAGLLTMLFEMVENTKLLKPWVLLLIKRGLFNTEVTLWGELIFSIVLQKYYFIAMNHSDLNPSRKVAEAVSHYVWSLISHSTFVLGQTACILTIRVLGTLVLVWYHFGSLRMLVTPCCVDAIMGPRYKLATLTGYVLHNSRLYYSKSALKAHGLLKVVNNEGKEHLVYHKIHWLPSSREDLEIIGRLTGEHVEPCPETLYNGPVAVCDRKLGGASADEESELFGDMDALLELGE